MYMRLTLPVLFTGTFPNRGRRYMPGCLVQVFKHPSCDGTMYCKFGGGEETWLSPSYFEPR